MRSSVMSQLLRNLIGALLISGMVAANIWFNHNVKGVGLVAATLLPIAVVALGFYFGWSARKR